MNWGFDEDEGWWAVGAHLLLIVVFAVPVIVIIEFALSISFVRNGLPIAAGLWVGAPVGDRVFRRLRQRHREWHRPRVGAAPEEFD